jgi:hypothetical protein
MLGFPDGRELYTARAVQAKEEAAWPTASHENSLADGKSAWLKLILTTQDVHHKLSQVFQIAYLLGTAQHCSGSLLC